jgi:cell division protein FtsB
MYKKKEVSNLTKLFIQVGLILVILWFAYESIEMYHRMVRVQRDQKAAETRYEDLTQRHERLSEKVQELSGPRGTEVVLREDYGAALPDEEVIVVVDEELSAPPPIPLTWWRKLLGKFGL